MRLKLKERIKELEPSLERWASCYAQSSIYATYDGRWYNPTDLIKCFCLGKDDPFPCPHCQNLDNWRQVHIHPAIVAELVRWWRTLLVMDNETKLGDLANLNAHLDARNRAAYAIYALERHHVGVETYNGSWLVKGKPGLDDSRNALLRSLLMKPVSSDSQAATTIPPHQPWRFVPPPATAPTYPNHWTAEQRQVAARYSERPPAPAYFDDPAPPLPPQINASAKEIMNAYVRHMQKVLGLGVTGVNMENDILLVDPKDVAEFVSLPCKAWYAVHEQTLVVKIAARDLLDRYCGGGGGDGSTLPADPNAAAPIADWLGAALGDPSQARGMCAQFGYSQEPELQRRRGVGLRRR